MHDHVFHGIGKGWLPLLRRHVAELSYIGEFAAENAAVKFESFHAVAFEGEIDVYCSHCKMRLVLGEFFHVKIQDKIFP
jgi:hypothetical protein